MLDIRVVNSRPHLGQIAIHLVQVPLFSLSTIFFIKKPLIVFPSYFSFEFLVFASNLVSADLAYPHFLHDLLFPLMSECPETSETVPQEQRHSRYPFFAFARSLERPM
jgi:hypothetical protein